MSATPTMLTSIGQAMLKAGIETTPKANRPKFSEQRAGESFAQWQERLRERRMATAEHVRKHRAGLTTKVSDGARLMASNEALRIDASTRLAVPLTACIVTQSRMGIADRLDWDTMLQKAIPERFKGRKVGVSTAQEIIDSLSAKFSRGMSAPKNKIRRPIWETGSIATFEKLAAQDALYHSHGFKRSNSDPLHCVQSAPMVETHSAQYGEGHTVASTIAESLATGGQRSDGMGTVTGMSEGSAKLSSLFQRANVGYFVRNAEGELATEHVAVLVCSVTGNSYIAPIEQEETQEPNIGVLAESCTNPAEYQTRLAAIKDSKLAERTLATKHDPVVKLERSTVTLESQYMRYAVYGPLTLEQSISVR